MTNYEARFQELITLSQQVERREFDYHSYVDVEGFQRWLASAGNLLELTYGKTSSFHRRFEKIITSSNNLLTDLQAAVGLFRGAADDYTRGFVTGLRREISDEFVIDTCLMAERLLKEGNLEPAAVLTAAALEDCFKRRAEAKGVWVMENGLAENANALKSIGDLSGASAKMVPVWNKFRNNAMHADWTKISESEIASICAFLKTFVLS